jgi:hypothetical protein
VLRFVDVVEECLTETRDLQEYVILSYVWGSIQSYRVTTAKLKSLAEPGGIESAMHLLPKTIRDAMLLCKKLGARFLSGRCPLPRTGRSGRGVNVMHRIYEHAWLTIVAACGHNANAGLPGVGQESRLGRDNAVEVTPGMCLGVVMPLDISMEQSVYNSRAWT